MLALYLNCLSEVIAVFRIQILADKSLKIHNVQVADEGIYVCRLDNPFGWQEAQAVLTVHCKPSVTESSLIKSVLSMSPSSKPIFEVTGSHVANCRILLYQY